MKTEPIHLRPGLSLYKQPITSRGGSPYWYARVRMKLGSRRVHTRSTGTTDVKAATKFAETFYGQCLIQSLGPVPGGGGIADEQRRFDLVADEWLDRKLAAAGGDPRALRAFHDARKLTLSPNGPAAFFKRRDLASIKTDDVRAYLAFAEANSRKGRLASTTKRNHLSVLSGIFRFAAECGLIAAAPPMPRLRLKDNPRPYFTRDEINKLCKAARVLAWKSRLEDDPATERKWQEVGDFVAFMLATFLRAGEWKFLRQSDCEIVKGPHPYLKVALIRGKTGRRTVVSMPEAIDAFERIVDRDGSGPEHYLFLNRYPNRETAKERMGDYFRELTDYAGLTTDPLGKTRTLYSLRHSSLMLRLLEGQSIDLFMLAKNAGTSISQLQRFYLSHAMPTMAVENLHATKPTVATNREGIQILASLLEPVADIV